MKHKSTLLLFIAVIIAGLVAYSLSRKPTSHELQKQRRNLLTDFDSSKIETLQIQQGDLRLTCRRADKRGWRIVEPVNVLADRWEVESILDKLELAEKVASYYPDKGKQLDAAEYGLDRPTQTITMDMGEGGERSWTVLIGKDAGVADSVFVSVEGQDGVFALPRDVVDKTAVSVTDLRSKRLAPRIGVFDLEKVNLSARALDGGQPLEVECQKSDGKWEIKKPSRELADSDKVQALASRLYDHRIGADDFVVDDPTKAAAYGLDDPDLTITLQGDEEAQTIVLSGQAEGDKTTYYAMHKGELAIVRVPESLFDGLRQEPDDLKERKLADVDAEDVAEVAIAGPRAALLVAKEDGDWQFAGEGGLAADDEATEQLLRGLKDVRIEGFVAEEPEDLTPYGLTEEKRTLLTLKDADGETLAEVAFGATTDDGGMVYAARLPYPSVLSLRAGACFEAISAGRLTFLDRLLLEEPSSEAVEVDVRRGTEHSTCRRKRDGAEWELVAPVPGKADRWAVQTIASDFSHLRAERFAAEKTEALAPFGLQEPEITVRIGYRAAPPDGTRPAESDATQRRERVLQVGAEADEPAGSRYARLGDDERIFVLPGYIVQHFRADLASRDICLADDVSGLTFRTRDTTLRFVYDRGKRQWANDEGDELEEWQANALEDAVALLRNFRSAKIADHVERSPAHYGFDAPLLVVELEEEATEGKTVVVGKEAEGGNRYAKGPATGFVHVASKADVERLASVLKPPAEPKNGE